jgi:hypothetical protein
MESYIRGVVFRIHLHRKHTDSILCILLLQERRRPGTMTSLLCYKSPLGGKFGGYTHSHEKLCNSFDASYRIRVHKLTHPGCAYGETVSQSIGNVMRHVRDIMLRSSSSGHSLCHGLFYQCPFLSPHPPHV